MTSEARILVVDDEPGIREGCRRALQAEGYLVDTAEDGLEGLEKVRQNSYDLVLADLMMPGMGGLELIQKIQQIDPQIIKVVITGHATIETAVEATKRGAYDYLPKPFSPESLHSIVRRGLEKRNLRLVAQKLYAEREKRLLEIANEQSRVRTIVGCMSDGVLVINLQEQLVLWNAASMRLLKSKGYDVPGESLEYYIRIPELIEAVREVQTSREKSVAMISREIRLDEQGIVLMANIAPVRDEEGKVLGTVTVLRDITQLKEIDKIKSQFVNMVAHELRAPLAAIKGWLELVISGEGGGDEQQKLKWLDRAQSRADSLLALVNDLLEVSRMEAGKVAQKMEDVQVAEILKKTVEFLEPEARQRQIAIKLDIPEHLPAIKADIRDMEKLFTNLISNAIKYNVDRGAVHIEGRTNSGYVHFRIKDTGIGISPEFISRIFDDFYRVENEKTKKITGTGLGLTIAKKIVDSHHGHIEVESTVGEGSLFTVSFPTGK